MRSEALADWAAGHYPRRRYPAVLVGSSNGAMTHLAALQIPWLPPTPLLAVRQHGVHPDEPADDMAAMVEPARDLLDANPDLALHHMHDANQDRLMIQRMTYFRVKRQRLGAAYERFLADHLEPGGTALLVDCTLSWPTTRVGERHVFQQGALGGATVSETHQGSQRVADYGAATAPTGAAGTRPRPTPTGPRPSGASTRPGRGRRAVRGRPRLPPPPLGVDEQGSPRLRHLARYHQALARVRQRYPPPPPLSLTELDPFLDRQGQRYAVHWK